MRYAVSAQEMKRCDDHTVAKIGIPALVLMERAAMETVQALLAKRAKRGKILVLSGVGNNGGDGLAAGRMLAALGDQVAFFIVGNKEKASEQTARQIRILENLGFSIQSNLKEEEYDIVIDALFGVGLSRNLEGVYRDVVEEINRMRQRGTYVVSVDVPSGICADTGNVMGAAIQADLTVTFAFAKRGLLLYPGKSYAGELMVRDIGIPSKAFGGQIPGMFYYEKDELPGRLPARRPDGNKGTFGKVLLIAGSRDMCGACVLAGKSILKTGAGMVKIIAPECNRQIIQSTLPEALLYSYEEMPQEREVQKALCWADAVVIGPGLGMSGAARFLLEYCLVNGQVPMVLDADALNMTGNSRHLAKLVKMAGERIILTPHPGELLRLLGADHTRYPGERMALVSEVLERFGCVVAAKDAVTLVSGGKEDGTFVNTTGNDGMATAGSGDVLAGIIGGLLAQKMSCFEAACTGVFLHGKAGDRAAESCGKHGMTAMDLISRLPEAMKGEPVWEEGRCRV